MAATFTPIGKEEDIGGNGMVEWFTQQIKGLQAF